MKTQDIALALDSIRRPVTYDKMGQRIRDAQGETVLDVRGWGRLGYYQDGAKRQDAIGQMLVELLNGASAEPAVTMTRASFDKLAAALEESSLSTDGEFFGPGYEMKERRRREAFVIIGAVQAGRRV